VFQTEKATDVLSSCFRESRQWSDSNLKVRIFRIVLDRSARLAILSALDEAGFSALPMKMLVGMD
jgi:hypothetical protein